MISGNVCAGGTAKGGEETTGNRMKEIRWEGR